MEVISEEPENGVKVVNINQPETNETTNGLAFP